ncbi:hypothetical protein [Pseudodesulfovibrio tunisiensis]|uniref:hypothetical protein n=1 Tax=Pseudodesulfovibrio tunisiensis TaxID=463192 RepID=UPI001FB2619B|nr:hypothetical protein [Pseudodesulfovibrio tunisiensis]
MNAHRSIAGNWFRHFFVGLYAMTYLSFGFMLVYQYIGMKFDWPGVFLTMIHDAAGNPWLDVNWSHPVVLGWATLVLCAATVWGLFKRHDFMEYREAATESQPGF